MKNIPFFCIPSATVVFALLCTCSGGGENFSDKRKDFQWTAEYRGLPYKIKYFSPKGENLQKSADSLIAGIVELFSLKSDSSFVVKFNRANGPLLMPPGVTELILKSIAISKETDGAFDVTILPYLILSKHLAAEDLIAKDRNPADTMADYVGYRHLMMNCEEVGWDQEECYLDKKDSRVQIDLGGIYKGYIADQLAVFFQDRQIHDFYVEVDKTPHVRCSGQVDYDWSVLIREPSFDTVYAQKQGKVVISLNQRGLGCSGKDSEFIIRGGQLISNYINPHNGLPVSNSLLSVVVIAAEATLADALATAFMVMGMDESLAYIRSHPGVEAYFIYQETPGKINTFYTKDLQGKIMEVQ